MKLDISHFKKISEDKHSAVLKHPNGHHIHISKGSLSQKLNKQLEKIPLHLDDGGDVPDSGDESDINRAPAETGVDSYTPPPSQIPVSAAERLSFVPKSSNEPTNAGSTGPAPASDAMPTNIAPPQMQAAQAPMMLGDMGLGAEKKAIQKGVSQMTSGENEKAAAISAQGNAEAPIYGQNADALTDEKNIAQARNDDLWKEHQVLVSDYAKGHINPNKFWEDKSSLGKISTGIGLILGGIGGGLTGQQNPALAFLNQQIDRNIEAQKANLGKTGNLLSANMHMYGTLANAEAVTREQLKGILASKIAQQAVKQQGPIAQAQAHMAIGELTKNTAPIYQEIAQRQAMQKMLQGQMGQGGQSNPGASILMQQRMGVITPQQGEQAMKEAQKAQEVESLRSAMQSSFDDLNSKALAGKFSPSDRQSAIQAFAGPIAKMGEGRFNLQEAQNQADALLPGIESGETRQNKQRRMNQFFDAFRNEPTLRGLPIPVNIPHGMAKPKVDSRIKR